MGVGFLLLVCFIFLSRKRWGTWERTYSECKFSCARDGFAVQQHFFHEYFARVFHTQGNHGKAVTNEDDVHAGVVGDVCAGKVMRRDHGDWLTLAIEALQCVEGDRFACVCGRSA
jgi:hypothetical protein